VLNALLSSLTVMLLTPGVKLGGSCTAATAATTQARVIDGLQLLTAAKREHAHLTLQKGEQGSYMLLLGLEYSKKETAC
jgi:hypothetical protein